jgi:nucleoside-diphosphate-sugar epimerase
MHVFITGGTGQTGPAIVTELIGSGHRVTGLARTDAAAARLTALGASALRGSLDDHDVLAAGAEQADGVVHMAFGGADFTDPAALTRRDVSAIRALGEPLVGSGRPLVITSGTLAVPAGRFATEQDPASLDAVAALRHDGEQACLDLAGRGVRSIVIRPAPTVHGPRDHGFVPMLISSARRNGVSAFIGDGLNRWPAVHRLDLADLYRLALEQAPAGSRLHGVGEAAVPFKSIAEKIADRLGISAVSVDAADAGGHFGDAFMAVVYGADAPASSDHTQRLLGWRPNHWTLLEDLDDGDYFAAS